MTRKIRLVHIINSFEFGGAEAMLCNLVLRSNRSRFDISVVSLIDDLRTAGPLTAAGIPVAVMGMKPGVPDPRALLRLARHLRGLRPDVIQTWMDHSNLIGSLAASLATRAPVVWGIHHSNHVPGLTKRSTLLTVAACGKLSRRWPARIVCCSDYGVPLYAKHGFDVSKMVVIPNGFDTTVFQPDPALRATVRGELNISNEVPLVGLIARYDPLKDHATFLRAASVVARRFPAVHFLLCGDKVTHGNPELTSLIRSLNLSGRTHLLGPRRDVARIAATLDLLVSSSISEAFPLVVGEAMACGVPCVVTDVGDSAKIVGETGRVVRPSDTEALGAACCEVLGMGGEERRRLGEAARERVRENFDLAIVTGRYEGLYEELVEGR